MKLPNGVKSATSIPPRRLYYLLKIITTLINKILNIVCSSRSFTDTFPKGVGLPAPFLLQILYIRES